MTNQQDAGKEEWFRERHGSGGWSWCLMAKRRGIDTVLVSNATEATVNQILADHAAARRARVLEEQWGDFMDWLTDQQVVHWTLTEETKDDPRKAVAALLQQQLTESFDPAISEIAAKAERTDKLEERVREAEAVIKQRCRYCALVNQCNRDWQVRLDALEATITTLKAKARMADGLRQWLRENEGDLFALGGALDQWIIDCDALATPAIDTGSDLETQESLAARVEAEARKWANIAELNAVRPEFSDTGSEGRRRKVNGNADVAQYETSTGSEECRPSLSRYR